MSSWRGEVEDGLGWGGLVPTAAERRAEKAEQDRKAQMEQLRAENARLREALGDVCRRYDDAGNYCIAGDPWAACAETMHQLARAALRGDHE